MSIRSRGREDKTLATLIETSRRFQLHRTLGFCQAHVPFYAAALAGIADEDLDMSVLRRFPVLTRSIVARDPAQFRPRRKMPDYMLLTGGTSGDPLVIPGTTSRPDLHTVLEEQNTRATGRPRPLLAMAGAGSQGLPPIQGGQIGTFLVPLGSRKGFVWLWQLLTERHDYEGFEERVTQLFLPTPAIKKLVNMIGEDRLDTTQLALSNIFTYSSHLSRGWRDVIVDTLRAPVQDVFGFSEIRSARARQCDACRGYHFDDKVIWEVLDPVNDRSITTGTGRLVVSGMHPHCGDWVLLRYESGDLVEIAGFCEAYGDLGFHPRGRRIHAVEVAHRGTVWFPVLAADVQEAVDLEPGMARIANILHSLVTITEDDAFPKWRCETERVDGRTIGTVRLELRWSPHMFPEATAGLRARVREVLDARNPILRQAEREAGFALRIEPVPPGTFQDRDIFRV